MEMTELLQSTVSQTVHHLSNVYAVLSKAGKPFRRFPSVMLWGAPGVGKSQGVRQIAAELRQRTGKRVEVTDVRLLLFNPVDLRGIPTANADKTLAVWLKPKIFQMEEGEDVINILFLDEISAAPPSVQAAAYQITLDRTVGEHRLPENCIVIAAGNRTTDRSVAYQMPRALANRLCHFEMEINAEEWRQWALAAGINRKVLGYISANPDKLSEAEPDMQALAFPTPRAWEMVSNILSDVSEDPERVYPLIAGCIGPEATLDFYTWCEVYGSVPSMEAVFAGAVTEPPKRPEALMATVTDMAGYARSHPQKDGVLASLVFAEAMPVEFRNKVFADYLECKALRAHLQKNRAFVYWFETTGRVWEDYGL